MLGEDSAVLAVGREHRFRVKALERQHLKKRSGSMTFAKDETVTIRIVRLLRVDAQGVKICRDQNVCARQAGAEMRSLRLVRVFDDARANLGRESLKFVDIQVLSPLFRHTDNRRECYGLCW